MNEALLDKFNLVEKHHWWWEGRRRLLKNTLNNFTFDNVLDVGCGTGETLVFLQKNYPSKKYFGIDRSVKAVSFAKSRKLQNIKIAEASKLPYSSNKFDLILLLDTLEHLEKPERDLKEIKRVLSKNGKLLVTVPALNFIWSDYDSKQGHYLRYNKQKMRKLVEDLDFEIKEIGYFNFFFSVPIIAIRLLSRIKYFNNFASYDNSFNLDIANKPINKLLTRLFLFEINSLNKIQYPWGISLYCVLEKKK